MTKKVIFVTIILWKPKTFLRQYVDFPTKVTSRIVVVGDKKGKLKTKQEGYVSLSIRDIIIHLFRFKDDFSIRFFRVTTIRNVEENLEEIKENKNMQELIKILKEMSYKK